MAYRESEFSELCGSCRKPADGRCRRCAAPICATHEPGATSRCFNCELGYLARETRTIQTVVVTLVIVGAMVGVFGALAAHAARNGMISGPSAHWAILIVPVAVAFLASAFMVPGIISRVMRRRFLSKRAPSRPA